MDDIGRWRTFWPDRPSHRRRTRIRLRSPISLRQARQGSGRRGGEQLDRGRHEERLETYLPVSIDARELSGDHAMLIILTLYLVLIWLVIFKFKLVTWGW